jgi:hypothetical protein
VRRWLFHWQIALKLMFEASYWNGFAAQNVIVTRMQPPDLFAQSE